MIKRKSAPVGAGTKGSIWATGRTPRWCAVAVVLVAALTALVSLGQHSTTPPPDPFVRHVARVRPSVLAVGTYDFKDNPKARYFGTGFVVGDGNTLATNAHVVDGAREQGRLRYLTVYAPDSRPSQGRRSSLWREDAFHDVALVRFGGPPLPALAIGPHQVRSGQGIGIVGYPIGMHLGVVPATHRGVVAAVVPAVRPLRQGAKLTPQLIKAIRNPYDLYQLDLVVYPGNSGSPLFDARTGDVLGIINKTLASQTREHLLTKPSGIGYAVPTLWLRMLASDPQPRPGGPSP